MVSNKLLCVFYYIQNVQELCGVRICSGIGKEVEGYRKLQNYWHDLDLQGFRCRIKV